MIEYLILFSIGTVTSMIGAVPFGLVNLTVLNVSMEQGNKAGLKIACGAAVIEVLFGLTAILAGSAVYQHLEGNILVGFSASAILIGGGVFFIMKKHAPLENRNFSYSGFLKGLFLNLVSIQVFLFWILAIAFLASRELVAYDPLSVFIFISGIWIGKMVVLILYMNLSNKMLSKSQVISKNINRIIGFVLIGMAIVQFIKL